MDIDYGLGQTNINLKTGIHYGVISQHSILPEALDDVLVEGSIYPTNCPECGFEVDPNNLPMACESCGFVSDDDSEWYAEESSGFEYTDSEYSLVDCLDSDVFVLKSSFYTHTRFCSPCVPGAGNLDSPTEDGARTYCLGHDWFEGGKAPYPVYRVPCGKVTDNSIVKAEA